MAYIKALLLLLLTLIICPGHAQEVANPAAPINIPRAELICNPKDDEATYAMVYTSEFMENCLLKYIGERNVILRAFSSIGEEGGI